MWELSGVPCVHAMVGYMHLNKDPNNGELLGTGSQQSWVQERGKDTNKKVVRPIGRNRQPVRPECVSKGGGRVSRGGRNGRGNETINVNDDVEVSVGRGTTIGRDRGRGRRGGGRVKGRKGTGVFLETLTAGYSGGPLIDKHEHYLRQVEEALREHFEEEARVEQEYLDRCRAKQEYEARMDCMHASHWKSNEDMPSNNPTQPTQ
uniref:Zinc finger PMZ-type domain-containing protein n=1 Tax=Tanacetum cinerariifolium TaxID=118510 RepID=A0A699JWE3_TANCI|nr:hypothetical protein [Tanacetum cinerariifolium]